MKRIIYTRSANEFPAFKTDFMQLVDNADLFDLINYPLNDCRQIKIDEEQLTFAKKADYLIFVSKNAVRFGFEIILENQAAQIISIGQTTTATLEKKFKDNNLQKKILTADPPFNSESLLKKFSSKNSKIAIICAENGRDFLHNELKKNNTLANVYVYERFNPSKNANLNLDNVRAIFIANKFALDNLQEVYMQQKISLIECSTVLVSISERITKIARNMNFSHIITAEQANQKAQLIAFNNFLTLTRGL